MRSVPEAPQGLAVGPAGSDELGLVAVAGRGWWQWRAGSREKLRPARPLQRPTREIVRPASVKTPILGCFERAGRTFSHSHPPPDHAGRTFSCTGRTEVVTVKPTTPLQPLIQASVKPPPPPMLAPEQHPLKPATPMQAKNAPKTPNSHPQRRCRFQLRLSRRPQRRCRFQTTGPHRHAGRRRDRKAMPQSPWAAAGPGRATSGRPTLQTSSNWCILKPSLRTRVTNVVNLRPKTTIFRKNAVGLTTFVTSAGKSAQKAARIDDVCNNTRRTRQQRPGLTGVKGAGGSGGHGRAAKRGAWPRCRWAVAGPGRASRSTTPSRRLACGDLAGGPPPTGTHSGPAHQGRSRGRPEICRGNEQREAARPHRDQAAHASGDSCQKPRISRYSTSRRRGRPRR